MYDTREQVLKEFVRDLAELLPRDQRELIDLIAEHVADLLDGIARIEVKNAHVVVETRDVGGLQVGFDAAGNAVTASFDEPVHVDFWPVATEESSC